MYFKKSFASVLLLISAIAHSVEDVTDLFELRVDNNNYLIFNNLSVGDAELGVKENRSWQVGVKPYFSQLRKFDDYSINMSTSDLKVIDSSYKSNGVASYDFKIYYGEFDASPGKDFLIWALGYPVYVLSPLNSEAILLPIVDDQGDIDVTSIQTIIASDINDDSKDDLIIKTSTGGKLTSINQGGSFSPIMATSGLIGNIPSEMGVSNDGALTYKVPIRIAPGINGFQPNLSFNYNSRADKNLLGLGWGLGGVSKISRCAKSYLDDGVRSSIEYDNTDKRAYCLDGKRVYLNEVEHGNTKTLRSGLEKSASTVLDAGLIETYNLSLMDGTNVASIIDEDRVQPRHYVQLINGNFKKFRYPVVLTNEPYEISNKKEYVNNIYKVMHTPGRDISWPLTSEVDTFGNEINYKYLVESGYAYIKDITYGGGKIEFEYDDRDDSIKKYLLGGDTVLNKKLKSVKTFYMDNEEYSPLASYSLVYTDNKSPEYSVLENNLILKSIEYCAYSLNGDFDCLDSLDFDWEKQTSLNFIESAEPQALTDNLIDSIYLDWNGDGLQDIATFSMSGIYILENFIKDGVAGNFKTPVMIYATDDNLEESVIPFSPSSYDIDNNNSDEIIFKKVSITRDSFDQIQQWIVLGEGGSKNIGPEISYTGSGDMGKIGMFPSKSPAPVVSDINGDGLVDIILAAKDSWVSYKGVSSDQETVDFSLTGKTYQSQYASFQYDHLEGADSVFIVPNTLTGSYHRLLISPDFSLKSSNPILDPVNNQPVKYKKTLLVDQNQDGYKDILVSDSGKVAIYFYNGRGYLKSTTNIDATNVLVDYSGYHYNLAHPTKISDLNNDGYTDLIYVENNRFKVLYGKENTFEFSSVLSDIAVGPKIENTAVAEDRFEPIEGNDELNEFSLVMANYISILAKRIDVMQGVQISPDKPYAYNYSVKSKEILIEAVDFMLANADMLNNNSACINSGLNINGPKVGDETSIDFYINSKIVYGINITLNDYHDGGSRWTNNDFDYYLVGAFKKAANKLKLSTCGVIPFEPWDLMAEGIEFLNRFFFDKTGGAISFISPNGIGADYLTFEDFSGDGYPDLVQITDNTHSSWQSWISNAKKVELIEIEKYFGKINVEYSDQLDSSVYDKSSFSPDVYNQQLVMPFRFVKSVTKPNGIGGTYSDNYSYKGLKYNRQGRGYLGVEENKIVNGLTGNYTINKFRQDYPFNGMVHTSESFTKKNIPLKKVENKYTEGEAFFHTKAVPQLDRTFKTEYESTGDALNFTRSHFKYNDFGSVKEQKSYAWNGNENINLENDMEVSSVSSKIENTKKYTSFWAGRSFIQKRTTTYKGSNNGENLAERNALDRSTLYEAEEYKYTNTPANTTIIGDKPHTRVTNKYDYFDNGVAKLTQSSSENTLTHNRIVNSVKNGFYPDSVNDDGYYGGGASFTYDYDYRFSLPTYNSETQETYKYDALGRTTESSGPDGVTTLASIVECGVKECSENIHAVYKIVIKGQGSPDKEFYYDLLDREVLSKVQNNEKNWLYTKTEYNSDGTLYRTSQPYLASPSLWTTYTDYDGKQRPLRVTKPDGSYILTDYSVNSNGLQVVTTNNHHKKPDNTEYIRTDIAKYDARGKIVEKINAYMTPEETKVEYDYDAMGNLDWVRANGSNDEVTTYVFDTSGNILSKSDPSTGLTTFEYDGHGNVLKKTDANNQITEYSYDRLSRAIQRVRKDSEREQVTNWYYDLDPSCENDIGLSNSNNLLLGKVCRASGVVDKYYRYDSRWNLTSELMEFDVNALSDLTYYPKDKDKVSSAYRAHFNSDNKLVMEQLASGARLFYDYKNGYLASVKHNDSELFSMSNMDQFFNPTQWQLGNGITVTNQYSPAANRLITSTADNKNIQDISLEWNTDGSLYSRSWDHAGTKREVFNYDSLGRLTSNSGIPGFEHAYSYYKNGNIKTKTGIEGEFKYGERSAGPYQLTTAGGRSYDYDGVGNMQNRNGDLITYGMNNKPINISYQDQSTTLQYDTDDQRYIKEDDTSITVYANGGRVEQQYRKSHDQVTQVTQLSGYANLIEEGSLADFSAKTQSVKKQYVLKDHLGSTSVVTDESGEVVTENEIEKRFSYDPFGMPRTPVDTITHRGFTGHEHLITSELIHMNGRVYDPLIARFLSADIVVQFPEFSQSYNKYSYVMNGPLSATDPSGYFFYGSQQSTLWTDPSAYFQEVYNNLSQGLELSIKDGIQYLADDLHASMYTELSGDSDYVGAATLFENPYGDSARYMADIMNKVSAPLAFAFHLRSGRKPTFFDKRSHDLTLRENFVPSRTGKELTTYYPANNGALGKVKSEKLEAGTVIDRYGREGGSYVSPVGTPFEMRALSPSTNKANLNKYEVVKPIRAETAIVAPAFNQIGLGIQHKLSNSVGDLVKSGHLKRVK